MATGYSPANRSEIHSSLESQQQSQTFSNIIQTTVLPVVLKYDSSKKLDGRLVTPAFNPKEPLLVHSRHRVRRIRARCVQFPSESNTVVDCGCDAVIPETYAGWFAVFGNPSTQTRDPIVPHYRRVSQLAISSCTRFLVSGDRPINVLLVRQGEGEQIDFHPTQVHPGTVLTKGKLFSTLSHTTKVKKRFRKKEKEKIREDKYMSAKDGYGDSLFLPCELEGLFYVLETETSHLPIPVLRLDDIIQRYRFPVLIKLVQGRIPSSSSFNGTLVLLSSEFTSFAITFSLNLHKESIFEIVGDSSLSFFLSGPEENESEEYRNALMFYKNHEDFFLHNIRFQNRNSDYMTMCIKDYTTNMDSSSFTGEKISSKGPDISCVRLEELRLFPPSPVTTQAVSDDKVPHPVMSLNIKEIRRTLTFDRPKDIRFDIIPIIPTENRKDSSTTVSSTEEERHVSNTHNSIQRHYSESECSSLSSASQPSLQDIETSQSEDKEEDMPPPPAEFLQIESAENEDVPEKIPDDSRQYYGIWTADTLDKHSTLSGEADEREGVRLRNKMDNVNGHGNSCPNHPAVSISEDENGYVIASELTVPINEEKNRRPASYISIHLPENEYDRLGDRDSGHREYNFYSSTSDEALGQIQAQDNMMLSSGSHYYASLRDVLLPENMENSKYINIPVPETGVNGAGSYENFSHFPRSFENQTPASSQNGKSEITSQLASSTWKNVRPTSESSTVKSSGYMNLQHIAEKDVFTSGTVTLVTASHKDRLLHMFKQHDLKKNTREALNSLREDDFVFILQAEDPVEKLKELVPEISKADVYKIGLCLKDLYTKQQ